MNEKQTHWRFGLLYLNRDDARLLVPLPCKLGLALNFANPRVVTALACISVALFLGLFVAPLVAHPAVFASNPTTPLLWLLAWLAAFVGIRLNRTFAWSDYRQIPLASYGLVAASIGFGLQLLICAPLILWWGGQANWTWVHGLVVGPVCGAAQTFGKWVALVLLLKVGPGSTHQSCLRDGLLVGLGFALYEVAVLYFPVAWAQAMLGYVSVWERVSASLFHIYSTGLVAVALWSGRRGFIAFVVAIHAGMDWLAVAARSLQVSVYSMEMIVSILAAITWVLFVQAARDPKQRHPDARETADRFDGPIST